MASNTGFPGVDMGLANSQGLRSHQEDSYTMIRDYKIGDDLDAPAVFIALFDGHSSHRAVYALLWGRELTVAHAGDSRAVLCRHNEAIRLTKDHKPASDPQERARIQSLGGKISYQDDRVLSNPEASGQQSSLNMSRALGDYGHKHPRPLVTSEPAVIHLELSPESEFLVLGTDGLFDVISAGDCCLIVKHSLGVSAKEGELKGDSVAGEAARALVAEALQRGTTDNVTAAVALLKWNNPQSVDINQVKLF